MRKVNFLVVASLIVAVSMTAKAETFYAYLSPAQEVPPVATSTATGYARVAINEAAGTYSFTVVFNGFSGNQTAAHIHAPAAIGANAAVAINFGAVGGTSGTITGSGMITATQIAQIRAHQGYVNVHSTAFPGGEVRGQLGIKRPVDFDGDGRQDLSVLRFPAGATRPITYWNQNTTTGIQIVSPFGDANTDFPTPGDFDGDGRDDVAVYRAGATTGASSQFFYLRSSNATASAQTLGLFGDQAVARDYDGDGITDAAVFRPGAAVGAQAFFFIRRSSDPGSPISPIYTVPWGTTGNGSTSFDTPVPGDYDGDGKFDVAVYRFGIAPANNFIILRSSDNAVVYQPWGNFNTDYIVPGDYDGDGKYDFAAARIGATATSPMVWWILQSSGGVRVQAFGFSSDVPVQGDYDGDARCDLAIYRAGATGAQSNFWIFRSFDNVGVQIPWGIGGDFATASFDAR
jgi:hypothetical protein